MLPKHLVQNCVFLFWLRFLTFVLCISQVNRKNDYIFLIWLWLNIYIMYATKIDYTDIQIFRGFLNTNMNRQNLNWNDVCNE